VPVGAVAPTPGICRKCLPRWAGFLEYRLTVAGALSADAAQTRDQSPFHPLYIRRPGTSPCFVRPCHGITGGAQGEAMTNIPYLFNQTIEQMHRIGSRGGKTRGRNWRARQRATLAGPQDIAQPAAPPQETTTQAMAVLDAQFAWLRGAESAAPGRAAHKEAEQFHSPADSRSHSRAGCPARRNRARVPLGPNRPIPRRLRRTSHPNLLIISSCLDTYQFACFPAPLEGCMS
jgi:hypothetical protein